jgi:2-polyprenyl-3-methyl-5-hydroxy-6-metoxy-1,4-benzoquinol methylase
MKMYNKDITTYYDNLYDKKDYKKECDLILKYSIKKNNVLDVGCGTMNHTIMLSKFFKNITALDVSKEMLDKGTLKLKNLNIHNVTTICDFVSNLTEEKKYDTVISMFNVINHILTLKDLIIFFNSISNLLEKDGTFIFDSWNGVASILDPPYEKSKKIVNGIDYELNVETNTKTNFLNLISEIETKIKVSKTNGEIYEFNYNLSQKLWTIDVICDILSTNNLEVLKIIPYHDDNGELKITDQRVTFICKKI